jgi:hypothetical protein
MKSSHDRYRHTRMALSHRYSAARNGAGHSRAGTLLRNGVRMVVTAMWTRSFIWGGRGSLARNRHAAVVRTGTRFGRNFLQW